jgi:hypothetical protein
VQEYSSTIKHLTADGFSAQPIIGIPNTTAIIQTENLFNASLAVNVGVYALTPTNSFYIPRPFSLIPFGTVFPTDADNHTDIYHYEYYFLGLSVMAEPGYHSLGYIVEQNGTFSYVASSKKFLVSSALQLNLFQDFKTVFGSLLVTISYVILLFFARCCPFKLERDRLSELTSLSENEVGDVNRKAGPYENTRELPTVESSVELTTDYQLLDEQTDSGVENTPAYYMQEKKKRLFNFSYLRVLIPFTKTTKLGLLSYWGPSFYFIRKQYQVCILFAFVMGIVSNALLLPFNLTRTRFTRETVYPDYAITSFSSVPMYSYFSIPHIALLFLYPFTGWVLFTIMYSYLSRKGYKVLSNDYTVMITGKIERLRLHVVDELNPHIESMETVHALENAFKERLDGKFGLESRVVCVNIPLDFKGTAQLLKSRAATELKLSYAEEDTREELTRKLASTNALIWRALSKTDIESHSIVFVTFETLTAARQCVKEMKKKQNNPEGYKYKIAPPMDVINWANIRYGMLNVWLRRILVYILALSVIAIYLVVRYIDFNFLFTVGPDQWQSVLKILTQIRSSSYYQSLSIIIIQIINEFIVQFVKSK